MISREGVALGTEAMRLLERRKSTEFHAGLTDAELNRVEQRFGFEFADDHRAFLAIALPVGRSWPDWRDGDPAVLHDKLDWPVDTRCCRCTRRDIIVYGPNLADYISHEFLGTAYGEGWDPVVTVPFWGEFL